MVATKDFNVESKRDILVDDIPLLSFKKGEVIIVTKTENQAKWCEGYVINKLDIKLGFFPSSFGLELNLKKSPD